jgi:polyisoprenoid-binding protein YceI
MKKASAVCYGVIVPLLCVATGSRSACAADTYRVDPVHSTTVFKAKHFGVTSFFGRFNNVSGSFTLDDADPAQSAFQVQIQTESIDTANAKRDQHLKSPDFFNAKQFPTIAFKSTSVKKLDADDYEVTGDLTLHGVTKPVTAKVTKTGVGKGPRGGQLVGMEANLTIKRSDFDMKFMLDGIGDEVQIMAGLEGARP